MTSRREFLQAGGVVVAGLALSPRWPVSLQSARVVQIEMRSDRLGSRVWFDPVGVFVEPGTTIRWIARENVHTATAYHPTNGRHSLRIPEGAKPWDSGFLVNPGDRFDVLLTVAGVYDFFCMPHEAAGMVGRIVVGGTGGPGARPYDYFEGDTGTGDWLPVPSVAQRTFPGIERILRDKTVRAG